jgi:hypothetical protein
MDLLPPGITFHRYGLGGFNGDLPVEGIVRTYNDRGARGATIAIKRLENIMKVSLSGCKILKHIQFDSCEG